MLWICFILLKMKGIYLTNLCERAEGAMVLDSKIKLMGKE